MLRSAVCDLGLHCLPITLLGVSRLQWVKKSVCWCATVTQTDQMLHRFYESDMDLHYLLLTVCPFVLLPPDVYATVLEFV